MKGREMKGRDAGKGVKGVRKRDADEALGDEKMGC